MNHIITTRRLVAQVPVRTRRNSRSRRDRHECGVFFPPNSVTILPARWSGEQRFRPGESGHAQGWDWYFATNLGAYPSFRNRVMEFHIGSFGPLTASSEPSCARCMDFTPLFRRGRSLSHVHQPTRDVPSRSQLPTVYPNSTGTRGSCLGHVDCLIRHCAVPQHHDRDRRTTSSSLFSTRDAGGDRTKWPVMPDVATIATRSVH